LDRKLASIQVVKAVDPIEGADRIERLSVLGWYCVSRKGEFKAGDYIVFIEPDAILPARPEFDFLKESNYRIKTRRFKKQISQGVCFPLSILPMPAVLDVELGDDVTDLLGIQKWEIQIPAQLQGQVKSNFPSFLHKTDEDRIQGFPELLDKHQGKLFGVSEKIDGTSCSLYLNNGEFGVCSRNMDLKETEGNAYWKHAREYKLETKMRAMAADSTTGLVNFAVQGELAGLGIQKNKLGLNEICFFVFNIYNIDTGKYINLQPEELSTGAKIYRFLEDWGWQQVPLISISYLLPKTVDELVEFSKGQSLLNPKVPREGIVLRPLVEEYSEDLRGRLSFKVINNEWLLHFEE
jgi:RNA ligase (TIGR02306 family)